MNDGSHDTGHGDKETNAWDVCEVDSTELSYSLDPTQLIPEVGFWSVILWFYHPSDLKINKRKSVIK